MRRVHVTLEELRPFSGARVTPLTQKSPRKHGAPAQLFQTFLALHAQRRGRPRTRRPPAVALDTLPLDAPLWRLTPTTSSRADPSSDLVRWLLKQLRTRVHRSASWA